LKTVIRLAAIIALAAIAALDLLALYAVILAATQTLLALY